MTTWIHELARGELNPAADQLLGLAEAGDPRHLIQDSTIEFLNRLQENFTEYAKVFNSYSEAASRFQEIKVYNLAQTQADFMLFRNQVKLLFTNPSAGVIQIAYARHFRGNLAIDGVYQAPPTTDPSGPQDLGRPQELLAQLGPFGDVRWTYQAETVTPEQVAKFTFSEFVRTSRDLRRTRTGNQAILEQIKTLLHEKGLDL